MTEAEKVKTLDQYNRYCVTMKTIGWPPVTHEEFVERGMHDTPVEPCKDKGPQWGTWGDHTAGHEHAHAHRDSEMRSKIRRLVREHNWTAEQVLAHLNKQAHDGAAQSGKGVAPIIYTLAQVESWMVEKSRDGAGIGEPLPNYSTELAHAPRAGDRARRKARRDEKFAERDAS